MLSEYLSLFSNTGPITICVRFKNFDGKVADQTMKAHEIVKIVSPQSDSFAKSMTFDEWPFEVYKYEIDPIKNLLTILARKTT